jgi:hypothetical protein
MVHEIGRFTMISGEDIASNIRHNTLKFLSVPLAALALGGCGLSTTSHQETNSGTTPVTTTTPNKKIIKKTVNFLDTTVVPSQEFKETVIADQESGGLPQTDLGQSILDYSGNTGAFISSIGEELKANQRLVLRLNNKQSPMQQATEYNTNLAAQINADTKAALNANQVDGIAFADSVSKVTTADLGNSWHKGCPVSPDSLSRVQVTYDGTDNLPHYGTEIVNSTLVPEVISAEKQLYEDHYEIDAMSPVAGYGGNYNRAINANDTMDFDCPKPNVTKKADLPPLAEYGENVVINGKDNPASSAGGETLTNVFDALDWKAGSTANQPKTWFFGPGN